MCGLKIRVAYELVQRFVLFCKHNISKILVLLVQCSYYNSQPAVCHVCVKDIDSEFLVFDLYQNVGSKRAWVKEIYNEQNYSCPH
jgi:hypothetical protein